MISHCTGKLTVLRLKKKFSVCTNRTAYNRSLILRYLPTMIPYLVGLPPQVSWSKKSLCWDPAKNPWLSEWNSTLGKCNDSRNNRDILGAQAKMGKCFEVGYLQDYGNFWISFWYHWKALSMLYYNIMFISQICYDVCTNVFITVATIKFSVPVFCPDLIRNAKLHRKLRQGPIPY